MAFLSRSEERKNRRELLFGTKCKYILQCRNRQWRQNFAVYEGVKLEDYVFCGPSCVFTNDLTPRAKYPKGSANYKKTLVKYGASIGANATIVCGHTVGEWALIGAGAVVTTNVPAHALMLGVPAVCKGWVCECGEILDDTLSCKACSRKYQKTESGLSEVK